MAKGDRKRRRSLFVRGHPAYKAKDVITTISDAKQEDTNWQRLDNEQYSNLVHTSSDNDDIKCLSNSDRCTINVKLLRPSNPPQTLSDTYAPQKLSECEWRPEDRNRLLL